jgi:hypothetical protein
MQILESQLRHQVRSLLKEEVYGTIATVYHGTDKSPEEFLKIFETGDLSNYQSTGWKIGKGVGSSYGHGLYTVWDKSENNNTFMGDYGKWIYKFKVNLYGFIIFHEDICKKVYGKSLTPLEQLKLLGKENDVKDLPLEYSEALSQPLTKGKYPSAPLAYRASNFLKGRVNGIIFMSLLGDGPVVVIYDPDIVTPMSWTKYDTRTQEIDPWTTWNASEIKQSLVRASHVGKNADPERLQQKFIFKKPKYFYEYSEFLKSNPNLTAFDKEDVAINTPTKSILKFLSMTHDENVQYFILQNPRCTLEIANLIFANPKNTRIKEIAFEKIKELKLKNKQI